MKTSFKTSLLLSALAIGLFTTSLQAEPFPTYTPEKVKLEPNAAIPVQMGLYKLEGYLTAIDAAVYLVRVQGYKCDSVSGFKKWIFTIGFTLQCNDYNYEYELKDKGRGIEITTK